MNNEIKNIFVFHTSEKNSTLFATAAHADRKVLVLAKKKIQNYETYKETAALTFSSVVDMYKSLYHNVCQCSSHRAGRVARGKTMDSSVMTGRRRIICQ